MSDPVQPDSINTELWEFPCTISFKTMATNRANIDVDVLTAIQNVVPGDYTPTVKPSAKGNYVSITVRVTLKTKQQVEDLYRDVRAIADVKMCL